jgi:pimeloyl-ACP methyl ester carboxylesterase
MLFTDVTVRASDGVQLSCRVSGSGPTSLLFLHGWGGSGSGPFWDRVLRHLDPSGLQVVLADLRGHGQSGRARDGYTTERFAHDMFSVADQVHARDLIVVAFSMSGRWAQWMACTQPHRVKGQILLGPAPATALPLTEELLDQWIRATATLETFEPFVAQFTKTPLASDALRDYYASVQTTPEHSLRESFRMCTHPAFSDSLGATRARTLVVAGAHDRMLPAEYLREEIVRKIPAARLAVFDCGHEIPLEAPCETAAIVDAFVAGLATGQSPQTV